MFEWERRDCYSPVHISWYFCNFLASQGDDKAAIFGPFQFSYSSSVTIVLFLFKTKFLVFLFISCVVTTVKPETVSIYQVKKTEKDTYKKRTNWRLKDLKLIDGKDETNVRIGKNSE